MIYQSNPDIQSQYLMSANVIQRNNNGTHSRALLPNVPSEGFGRFVSDHDRDHIQRNHQSNTDNSERKEVCQRDEAPDNRAESQLNAGNATGRDGRESVSDGSEFRIARKLLRRRHILKERREQREAREREARLRKRQREGVEINAREAKRKSVFALRGEGDEIPVFDSLGCRTGNTSSELSNQRYGVAVRATAGNK